MEHTSHEFLRQLLETPSPSGFEQPIQQVVRDWVRPFADEVHTDRHGNVFAARFPEHRTPAPVKVLLAGHCDQIGLMVQHIDSDGFLYVQPIGGWDMQILLGQYLTVWTKSGPVTGVVARRAVHLLKPDERNRVPEFSDVWVDVGAKNKEEAESLVRHGDPVTFALGYRPLRNGLAASPAMDDKVGLWVCMEAVRLLHGRPLQAAVYGVSTVAEEIGLRGDGHAGQRQEDAGRGEVRGRAGALPRAEHQPAGVRPPGGDGEGAQHPGAGAGRAAGDRDGRERDPDQPGGRRLRADRHPEPVHAQPGGGGPPRRPRRRGEAPGRVLRRGHPRDELDSLIRSRENGGEEVRHVREA